MMKLAAKKFNLRKVLWFFITIVAVAAGFSFVFKQIITPKTPINILLAGKNLKDPGVAVDGKESSVYDTLVLILVNPGRNEINLVSIPVESMEYAAKEASDRPAPVPVPKKVSAEMHGTLQAVHKLTGARVDRFIEIGEQEFIRLVNLIGAVEIHSGQPLHGPKVLAYLQGTYGFADGMSRLARQRAFLQAVSLKLRRENQTFSMVKVFLAREKFFKSNLGTLELVGILNFIRKLNPARQVFHYVLPGSYYEGEWLPDPVRILKLMRQLNSGAGAK